MPTVNELRSQIADEIGLSTTTDTAALDRALNRALRRIVRDTDCLRGTPATLAGDASTVDVSLSSLTNLRAINSVYLYNGMTYSPLRHAPVSSIIQARNQSTVTAYAWEGGSLLLDGPVGTANSLYVRWSASPTALAAGGAESTITANGIPVDFHEDLLGAMAMATILEGYEGEEQRASYYRSQAEAQLKDFKAFLVNRAGDEAPRSRGTEHFHTGAPLGIR